MRQNISSHLILVNMHEHIDSSNKYLKLHYSVTIARLTHYGYLTYRGQQLKLTLCGIVHVNQCFNRHIVVLRFGSIIMRLYSYGCTEDNKSRRGLWGCLIAMKILHSLTVPLMLSRIPLLVLAVSERE